MHRQLCLRRTHKNAHYYYSISCDTTGNDIQLPIDSAYQWISRSVASTAVDVEDTVKVQYKPLVAFRSWAQAHRYWIIATKLSVQPTLVFRRWAQAHRCWIIAMSVLPVHCQWITTNSTFAPTLHVLTFVKEPYQILNLKRELLRPLLQMSHSIATLASLKQQHLPCLSWSACELILHGKTCTSQTMPRKGILQVRLMSDKLRTYC